MPLSFFVLPITFRLVISTLLILTLKMFHLIIYLRNTYKNWTATIVEIGYT